MKKEVFVCVILPKLSYALFYIISSNTFLIFFLAI